MKITQEEVTHVANLSKLRFSEKKLLPLRPPCLRLLTWLNCWAKLTQLVSHLLRLWLTARLYSALMWLKKEQTVIACLKTYLKRQLLYQGASYPRRWRRCLMTFNNKTIEELHNLLVSKEISATELTQATLENIKSREEASIHLSPSLRSKLLFKLKPLMKLELMLTMSFQEFHLLLRITSLQTVFSQLLPQKCSTTMSQSLMRQLLPMQKPRA